MRLLLIATLADTLRAFYLPIATHFRKAGWQVDGMGQGMADCPNCQEAFDQAWDVPLTRNPLDVRNLLLAQRTISSIVESNLYDIVHVSTPIAAFVTRFALRRLRKHGRPKVIYTAHGFHFHEGGSRLNNALYLGAERLAGRWTDCLTVMNEEDRRMARQYRIVPAERLTYIPGVGIDRSQYSPEAVPEAAVTKVRRELSLEPGQPLFLMVADLSPRKRHRDALEAFALIRSRDARFAFAGVGSLLEPLLRLASRLGIRDRVHFLGTRRDIPALVRASVATVLPSSREGLPRSVMEALSLGVPVIGSDVRGTKELLAGGGGLLVTLGDIDGLAQAMNWILDRPAEAQAMGRRGREAMAKFDLSTVLAMHEALYCGTAQEDPARWELAPR